MIPSLPEILRTHTLFARRHALNPRRDETLIAEGLRLAEQLAAGRVEDEPAAVLYALSRRWSALGEAWEVFPVVYARNLATAGGNRLDISTTDVDLGILRLKIVTGAASFEDVRAWLAAHLRPL